MLTNLPVTRSIQRIVNKQIKDAMDCEVVIIPMLPAGVATEYRPHGDHWVLVKYTVLSGTWTFYNSMLPKKSPLDPYYRRFNQLVSICLC